MSIDLALWLAIGAGVLAIVSVTQPARGNVQISSDRKSLLYSAQSAVSPPVEAFTYTISDGEMLTGVHPFAAETRIDVQTRILRDVPVSMRLIRAHIPRSIEDVVFRALSKDPRRRYADAYAMQSELRRASLPIAMDEPDLRRRTHIRRDVVACSSR